MIEIDRRDFIAGLGGAAAVSLMSHEARADALEDDLDGQRLLHVPLDLDQVFADAGELSARHAAKHLARSLDLLHVAAARAAGYIRFVSADDRQLAVAKATGLTAVDIKRRRPR